MELKVGDLVKIIDNDSDDCGKISKIREIYDRHPFVYSLENIYGTYIKEALLKIEYKVGDTIRVINKRSTYFGETYTITEIERYPLIKASNRLALFVDEIEKAEPKFKVGDSVKVNNPGSINHNKIGTITKVYPNLIYTISGVKNDIAERFLELYKDSEFKRGDFVTYKSGKAVYKVTEIIEGSIGIKHLQTGSCYSDRPEKLYKLKFQKGETVLIKDKNIIGIIDSAQFNGIGTVSYKVNYSNGITSEFNYAWVLEDNLESIKQTILTSVETSEFTTIKLAENIIRNDNLKNEDNENRLQREKISERERNDERGSRIYGRKSKSTVKIKCLSYEKVYCRS